MPELNRIDCECGFAIQSPDRQELTRMVQTHARDQHDRPMSREDVERMMRPLGGPTP